jgi:Domain of unknown function (DUF4365)
MITTAHRMEALARAYLQALAAQAGLSHSTPDFDYGIDISLRSVDHVGGKYLDSGVQVDIQLRSTTRASRTSQEIVFDLDVRTFNHLCGTRWNKPRILVLLVLPDDEAEWLVQSAKELSIRECAYWLSLQGMTTSEAASSVRVRIPIGNMLTVAALRDMMDRVREGGRL